MDREKDSLDQLKLEAYHLNEMYEVEKKGSIDKLYKEREEIQRMKAQFKKDFDSLKTEIYKSRKSRN